MSESIVGFCKLSHAYLGTRIVWAGHSEGDGDLRTSIPSYDRSLKPMVRKICEFEIVEATSSRRAVDYLPLLHTISAEILCECCPHCVSCTSVHENAIHAIIREC